MLEKKAVASAKGRQLDRSRPPPCRRNIGAYERVEKGSARRHYQHASLGVLFIYRMSRAMMSPSLFARFSLPISAVDALTGCHGLSICFHAAARRHYFSEDARHERLRSSRRDGRCHTLRAASADKLFTQILMSRYRA